MDAVGDVEIRIARDALKQERDEGKVVFFRKGRVEGSKLRGVGFAQVWRHLHACEDDLDVGIFFAGQIDDALEVFSSIGEIDTAQTIVGAQSQHEDVDRFLQHPIGTTQAAGRGFAAEARSDDFVVQTLGGDAFANEGRVGLALLDAVARSEAVAQKKNAMRCGIVGRSKRSECESESGNQ